MSPEAGVNLTVKELIALHSAAIVAEIKTVDAKVDRLELNFNTLETKVESVAEATKVSDALSRRQHEVDSRARTENWSRKDRTIAGMSVGIATFLGIANLAIILTAGH